MYNINTILYTYALYIPAHTVIIKSNYPTAVYYISFTIHIMYIKSLMYRHAYVRYN